MAKKRLKSVVVDNHGNEYAVYLEDDRGGAVVNIDGAPGRWSIDTLLNGRMDDTIYVDMGQKWYVTGMRRVMQEVLKNVTQRYMVSSDIKIARELLKLAESISVNDRWEPRDEAQAELAVKNIKEAISVLKKVQSKLVFLTDAAMSQLDAAEADEKDLYILEAFQKSLNTDSLEKVLKSVKRQISRGDIY